MPTVGRVDGAACGSASTIMGESGSLALIVLAGVAAAVTVEDAVLALRY